MSYNYNLKIHTGDERYAGTDSNIFIILHGTLGTSPEYRLNGLISGNAFERNQTDSVTLSADQDYGDIYKIKIRSDCAYGGSDWLLNYVDISTQSNPDNWGRFLYSKWITDKNSHEIISNNITASDNYIPSEITIKSNHIITVPAGAKYVEEDSYQTKTGYRLSEAVAKSIVTETKVDISGKKDAIQAAVSFALKTSNSTTTTTEITFEKTETIKQTLTFKESTEEKKYRALYTMSKEEHTITLGNLKIVIPAIVTVKGAGYEEVI